MNPLSAREDLLLPGASRSRKISQESQDRCNFGTWSL